jgi:hypothetical protein
MLVKSAGLWWPRRVLSEGGWGFNDAKFIVWPEVDEDNFGSKTCGRGGSGHTISLTELPTKAANPRTYDHIISFCDRH